MRVYIATGFDRAQEADVLASALESRGVEITYAWFRTSQDDIEAVCGEEIRGVTTADAVVAWLPGGRGTHIEIGMALGSGVPVVLLHREHADLNEPPFYLACRQARSFGDVVSALFAGVGEAPENFTTTMRWSARDKTYIGEPVERVTKALRDLEPEEAVEPLADYLRSLPTHVRQAILTRITGELFA